jgi:hypothetical protein
MRCDIEAETAGRNRKLDFNLDPDIVIPGDREAKIMKQQRKKYGKSLV